MKKIFLVLLALVFSLSLASCKEKSEKTSSNDKASFVMEFRKQVKGQDITGEIVSSYVIEYNKESCTYVIDAFKVENDKCILSDTDYFTISRFDTAIGFNKGYIKSYNTEEFDLSWSYSAYNGGYSLGLAQDKLEGLTTYTIVIDGWK